MPRMLQERNTFLRELIALGCAILEVGQMLQSRWGDRSILFLANVCVLMGAMINVILIPGGAQALSDSQPSGGDFLMASGIMVRLAFVIGAWWERGGEQKSVPSGKPLPSQRS